MRAQVPEIGSWHPPRTDSPMPHRAAGSRLEPQRYIIGWHDGIVKIGLTWNGKRRWGIFLGKGGYLLDLATYENKGHALGAEMWLQRQVEASYSRAFRTKEESTPYVGKAGGWTECYRIPATEWPELLKMAVK